MNLTCAAEAVDISESHAVLSRDKGTVASGGSASRRLGIRRRSSCSSSTPAACAAILAVAVDECYWENNGQDNDHDCDCGSGGDERPAASPRRRWCSCSLTPEDLLVRCARRQERTRHVGRRWHRSRERVPRAVLKRRRGLTKARNIWRYERRADVTSATGMVGEVFEGPVARGCGHCDKQCARGRQGGRGQTWRGEETGEEWANRGRKGL